jgi:hypothetical protein
VKITQRIVYEPPPDTVWLPDTSEIDWLPDEPEAPEETEAPQNKRGESCARGELFLWIGHYSPLPRIANGRGEFFGGMGERFFGCGRVQFGLGGYANGWTWKSYSGRSKGFDLAGGPALNVSGDQAQLMGFVYYDLQGSWFDSDHQSDVYWSRQWSHSVFPGVTFGTWSADGDKWFEAWLNSRIMVAGFKSSTIDGNQLTLSQDPAGSKSEIFFGSRVFPLSGFYEKKLHLGFSFKASHSFDDDRYEVMSGPVLDIKHIWKISLDWKATFNSDWERENGQSVGIILDCDVVNLFKK